MARRTGGGWPLTAARAVARAAAAAAILGMLGPLHPAFDSLGHFRAHFAALAIGFGTLAFLLWAVAFGRGRAGAREADGPFLALLGAVLLWPLLPYLVPQESAALPVAGERRYTLLQMNLRFDAEPDLALRRIEETQPDFVTVQEATERWKAELARLAAYPYRSVCARGYSVGGAVVLSRFPPAGPQTLCSPADGFTGARIDLGGGRGLTLVSQHLAWPWPAGQWGQIANLEPRLAGLAAPVLLAGDFNAAPWSAAVSTYARQGGLAVVPGIGPTWFRRGASRGWIERFGLPIDNVLHSPGIEVLSVRRLAPTASDHLPLLVTFRLAVEGG